MEKLLPTNPTVFNCILYIGEEPKACLIVIEKFNRCLLEIEQTYAEWFDRSLTSNQYCTKNKLQYHIKYHFEGGIAIFKFRDEEKLPVIIRQACMKACKDVAFEISPAWWNN